MIIFLTEKKHLAWVNRHDAPICTHFEPFFLCKKMTQQTCSWRVNQVFQPWLWTFSLCYVQGLLHFVRFTAYVLPVQISKVLQHNKTLFQHFVSTCPTGASTKYLVVLEKFQTSVLNKNVLVFIIFFSILIFIVTCFFIIKNLYVCISLISV